MEFKPRDTAGGVVLNSEGKLVIVWQNKNSWSFPKGAIEKGETELEAAKREVWEETGLSDLEFIKELGSYYRHPIGKDGTGEDTTSPQTKKIMFLFKTATSTLEPQEHDVTEARWVTVDEALNLLTHYKDREFLISVKNLLQ